MHMNRITFAVKSALGLAMLAPPALIFAQSATNAAGGPLEEVVITGIRLSLQESLQQKRDASSAVEVVTAEDIGKMPDKNIADSLQRLPGMTISSSGASEGGFDENDRVSMRGTGPSLTQTLINGHNVASGDWFVLNQVTTVGRSVSYTLLPSELVSKVVVHKSSEASLVEGGVAGSVDIITRKPLDFHQAFTLEGSLGAVYASLPSKTDPQLSALMNWRNESSTFGVMLQAFSETRHLRRDGVELLGYERILPDTVNPVTGAHSSPVAAAHPDLANVWYPKLIGAALFEQERKRKGGLVDFQFKPAEGVTLDLTGFLSKLDGPNYNRNYLLWNTHFINQGGGQSPDPGYVVTNGTLTQATFTGVPGRLYGVYDQISRPDESASSNFINLDGNFVINDRLTFAAQFGTSEGHGKTPTQDVSETDPGTGMGAAWQLHGIGSAPNFNLGATNNTTPFPNGVPVDFNWIFGAQNVDIVDKENWGKLDATFAMQGDNWVDLKFGVRYAKHDRTSDNAIAQGPTFTNPGPPEVIGGNDVRHYPSTWSNYPTNFNTFGGQIPTGIWYWTPAQLAAYNGPGFVQRGLLPRAYYQYLFQVHEKDLATYLQADFKGKDWTANIGLRVVDTQEDIVTYTQVAASTPGAITTSLFGPYIGLPVNHNYSDVLPSANLKINLAPDLLARFATSETMTRPDYSALAGFTDLSPPGNVICPGNVPCVGSGTGGNPDLKPIRSFNYDAGLEWYFAKRSLLSATLFYMDLQNFVGYGSQNISYTTFGSQFPIGGQLVPYQLTVPVNASGRAQGMEFAYQQALGEHFGVDANYTYTDGKQTSVVTNGDDRLVGTSKNTYNVSGFYEDAHFSARVAYNYRSAYFSGLDRNTAFSQDAIASLSASFGYTVNEHFSVTLDGQNLNDATLKYYALNTDQPRAFYKNGRQFYLNLRAKF
jgi:iron complex outermembrane receptor protein